MLFRNKSLITSCFEVKKSSTFNLPCCFVYFSIVYWWDYSYFGEQNLMHLIDSSLILNFLWHRAKSEVVRKTFHMITNSKSPGLQIEIDFQLVLFDIIKQRVKTMGKQRFAMDKLIFINMKNFFVNCAIH